MALQWLSFLRVVLQRVTLLQICNLLVKVCQRMAIPLEQNNNEIEK